MADVQVILFLCLQSSTLAKWDAAFGQLALYIWLEKTQAAWQSKNSLDALRKCTVLPVLHLNVRILWSSNFCVLVVLPSPPPFWLNLEMLSMCLLFCFVLFWILCCVVCEKKKKKKLLITKKEYCGVLEERCTLLQFCVLNYDGLTSLTTIIVQTVAKG